VCVIYLNASTHFIPIQNLIEIKTILLLFFIPIVFKYTFQLLTLPLYPIIEYFRASKKQYVPSVSVLIPAWNEEVGIIKTLESVIETHYPKLEIVLINDGSTDKTHELISHYIHTFNQKVHLKKGNTHLRYANLSNRGKAGAINHALTLATGEFIITLDADSVMDKSMISNILKRFTENRVAAVAGNVVVGNRKKPIELIQQLEYLHGFCFKRSDAIFNSVHTIGGAAAAYRKSALIDVGDFDESIITEDVEISTRLLAKGYKTRYAADAVVFTEGPSDWKGLSAQRLRWKFGQIQTYFKHYRLFFNPSKQYNPYLTFLVLPIAVYLDLILLLEPFILGAFYGYTFYTNHYIPLLMMIGVTTSIISLQVLFDPQKRFHHNLLILAPIAWLLFYVIDLVQFQALCRSIYRLLSKEKLKWQTWKRVGLVKSEKLKR
jgi:cellulose synthase/poly-beta-1,6-N-acetylglucosamine synthase-like glycosyltransferase